MLIPDHLMPHGGLVRVKPLLGSGATGQKWGPEVTPDRACIQSLTRQVTDTNGETVVSSTTVWLDPNVVVTPNSKLTIWLGRRQERVTKVISVAYLSHGDNLPEHQDVVCT